MARFHSRRLFGKVQKENNRLAEVVSVCMKDVILVSNKETKAYFIRSNTGWIVMCNGSLTDEKEQLVRFAEAALKENISGYVKGVIFSRPLVSGKEYIPEVWKNQEEELSVYVPDSQDALVEEAAVAGTAWYQVKNSSSVLLDGLEVQLFVDEKGQTELGFYLPRYQVFQPGEKYRKPETDRETSLKQTVFSAKRLLEEWKQEVEQDAATEEESTFLLEIRNREELEHFAVKLQNRSLEYVEVEEELADYFWNEELPIVQITKEKLGRVFAQKEAKSNWYDSLIRAVKVA